MKFTGKSYVVVFKWLATIFPALGVLYVALAETWNLPFGEQIAATLGAFTTFLMVIIGISKPDETIDDFDDPEN